MRLKAAAALAALVLLACSCATNRNQTSAWMKDGQKIGTIEKQTVAGGTELHYKDLNGRLMRIETIGYHGKPSSGACVAVFTYSGGILCEERHQDTNGQLAINPQGYAVRRWRQESDPQNQAVTVEESLYDTSLKLVSGRNGYAVIRRLQDQEGRVRNIKFLDANSNAAPVIWLEVANVSEARYEYLQALTEVVCVALLDRDGNVIARKQLNGSETSIREDVSYSNYYYYQPRYYYYRPAKGHR